MPRRTGRLERGETAPGSGFANGLRVDLRIIFGESVRRARQEAGLTQRDVESRTGIKQHSISEIESGKQNPTLSTMSVLATCFGKELSSMLSRDDNTSKRKNSSAKLAR